MMNKMNLAALLGVALTLAGSVGEKHAEFECWDAYDLNMWFWGSTDFFSSSKTPNFF